MAKLSHVHIGVSDLARSIDFYSGKLGLESTKYAERSAAVGLEPGSLDLDEVEPDEKERFSSHRDRGVIIAIKVPDLDAYYSRIIGKGVQTEDAPTKRPWGAYNFYLKDPDGYTIEVEEERPE